MGVECWVLMISIYYLLGVEYWLMGVECWVLMKWADAELGYWKLVDGCWMLGVDEMSWWLVGVLKVGWWVLNVGCWWNEMMISSVIESYTQK